MNKKNWLEQRHAAKESQRLHSTNADAAAARGDRELEKWERETAAAARTLVQGLDKNPPREK